MTLPSLGRAAAWLPAYQTLFLFTCLLYVSMDGSSDAMAIYNTSLRLDLVYCET